MAEHVIRLPDVGEGVAEAELVEWHVKVGDLVREDALLAAVMTDKATVEIPSPVDGEIIWLGAEIGDKVAVGSDLVRLKVPARGTRTRRAASAGARSTPKPRAAEEKPRGDGETADAVSAPSPSAKGRDARRRHSPPLPRPRLPAIGLARRGARSSRSPRRPCACARERPASTCGKFLAPGRPAASRTRISTPSLRAGPRVARAGRPAARRARSRTSRWSACAARSPRRWRLAHSRIPHITYVEEVDVTALEELRATLNKQKRARISRG